MAAHFHRGRIPHRSPLCRRSEAELQEGDRAVIDATMAMGGDPAATRCGPRCQNKPRRFRPRPMHQSTLSLGDTAPCYTTTHTQSYSGRSADGRPLIFRLRDPSFPSQHRSRLDLSDNATPLQRVLQSHSNEVHAPQRVTPRVDSKLENWTQHHSGRAVRELINLQHPSEYRTTYITAHKAPDSDGPSLRAGGRRIQWHQHNILTGEEKQADQGKSSRRPRDKLLWAARRWETDCTALRLY